LFQRPIESFASTLGDKTKYDHEEKIIVLHQLSEKETLTFQLRFFIRVTKLLHLIPQRTHLQYVQ